MGCRQLLWDTNFTCVKSIRRIIMETLNWTIPSIIVVSIGLELWLDIKGKHGHYDRTETKENLIIALVGFCVNLLVRGTMIKIFLWLAKYAVFNIGSGPFVWILLFLLTDLQSYLFHYLGHKSRFFWAMHVIHHSSHKFNFTTAIRTPFTNSVFRVGCLTPLVLLGFEPEMVFIMDALIIFAAFFQHTEMVGKLGWIEYVVNTPSHHRVHHASNEAYIDKNFGGALIIWDRMFGTFREEDEPPVYGLTIPLKDRSILNILFHEWHGMARDVCHASGFRQWMNYIFSRPGWKPPHGGSQRVKGWWRSRTSRQKALVITVLLSCTALRSYTQTAESYLRSGLSAEARYNDTVALGFYRQAIEADPENVEAVWRASRALSRQAGYNPDKRYRAGKANEAHTLANRAIQLDPTCIQARLARVIALGMASAAASSPTEKLANARVIHREIHTILAFDSAFAPAYYVLGKWHLELSKLNWAERLACTMLFGGVPEGVSIDESIRCFDRAIQLQSDFLLFYHGKASALCHTGRYAEAIVLLQHALRMAATHPDDSLRRQNCERLLEESKRRVNRI